jgi:hypothetical protein
MADWATPAWELEQAARAVNASRPSKMEMNPATAPRTKASAMASDIIRESWVGSGNGMCGSSGSDLGGDVEGQRGQAAAKVTSSDANASTLLMSAQKALPSRPTPCGARR